jgi:hypothetical protein
MTNREPDAANAFVRRPCCCWRHKLLALLRWRADYHAANDAGSHKLVSSFPCHLRLTAYPSTVSRQVVSVHPSKLLAQAKII